METASQKTTGQMTTKTCDPIILYPEKNLSKTKVSYDNDRCTTMNIIKFIKLKKYMEITFVIFLTTVIQPYFSGPHNYQNY